VQVGPAVAGAVNADGQVRQAGGIDVRNRVLNDRLGVLELDLRNAPSFVPSGRVAVSGLCDFAREAVNRIALAGGGPCSWE
jgi:hypothetical protein